MREILARIAGKNIEIVFLSDHLASYWEVLLLLLRAGLAWMLSFASTPKDSPISLPGNTSKNTVRF